MEAKIRHLCSVIHDVEWSGTLFYTYTGSIENNNLEINCVDLFVMDIGSSGQTEFAESPDIVTYRVEHNLLDSNIQEGLIHSHNNMATFFSGTDQDTLLKEGMNCNHFVSLIVNNAGKYTAAITRRVTKKSIIDAHVKYTDSKYFNSYGGRKVILEDNTVREEDINKVNTVCYVEYFDLKVNKMTSLISFEDIDLRLAEIRKSKSKVFNNTRSSYSKSLWDDFDFDDYGSYYSKEHEEYKAVNKRNKAGYFNESVYKNEYEKAVEEAAIKILTSCAIVNCSTIDIKSWMKKIDDMYRKHFKDLKGKQLRLWFELFIEYVCSDEILHNKICKESKESTVLDPFEYTALAIYDYLDKITERSIVLDIIMDILINYLPYDGVSEYK
ncbi:MAG: hypothetical protein IJU02_07440 [Lachnospiraceae bacterium]|nr:hypothetical protein [Lachnospiraceae bacterium]